MKTIVTGGAGLIGSHLVKRLLEQGREVVVADNFSRGSIRNLTDLGIKPSDLGLRNIEPAIDLRELSKVRQIISGAEVVFHLAAVVGSVEYLHSSEVSELAALQANLMIDANVFQACLESQVRKIIYASSVSVYPIARQQQPNVVLSEDDCSLSLQPVDLEPRTINPEGGYGWAKLLGEIQLQWMRDTNIGIARIFNVYGEGEDLGKSAHVVPALIRKAILHPRERFIVWGDGKQSRDLLYVSDCVDAVLKLEEKASCPPLVVNIGSDKTVFIGELAQEIVRISGKAIKMEYDPTRPVGPISRTADVSRVKALLGWQPKIALEEGLARTYSWVKKRIESNVSPIS